MFWYCKNYAFKVNIHSHLKAKKPTLSGNNAVPGFTHHASGTGRDSSISSKFSMTYAVIECRTALGGPFRNPVMCLTMGGTTGVMPLTTSCPTAFHALAWRTKFELNGRIDRVSSRFQNLSLAPNVSQISQHHYFLAISQRQPQPGEFDQRSRSNRPSL